MRLYTNLGLILLMIAGACNGQQPKMKKTVKDNPVNTEAKKVKMEKFDIRKYEERKMQDPAYDGYKKDDHLYVQQYNSIKEGYISTGYEKDLVTGYTENFQYKDGRRTVKDYDRDGNLVHVGYFFSDHLEIGTWEQFDPAGKLIKTENKDLHYRYSLEQVLAFGKTKDVDFIQTGKLDRYFSDKLHAYVWKLYWNTGKPGKQEGESVFRTILLDASNGTVLSDEETSSSPILIKSY